jgi:hypothetical protein
VPDRKKFERDILTEALDEIAVKLPRPIKAFLIGGLSMIFHGAKSATKDVDIVFSIQRDAQTFIDTAEGIGLDLVENLPEDYIELEARCVLEGGNGVRFDIFIKKVCNALTLSPGMIERAEIKYEKDNLRLYVVSIEDIFLFKSITSRPDDLADMAVITGKDIQWDIIKEEAGSQSDYWKWVSRLYFRLLELEEKYKIPSPLITTLKHEAEIAQAIGVILMRFGEKPFSFEDAAEAIKEDKKDFVEQVLTKMIQQEIIKKKNNLYCSRF